MPLEAALDAAEGGASEQHLVGVLTDQAAVSQMMVRVLAMEEELDRYRADGRESHPAVEPLQRRRDAYVAAVNRATEVQLQARELQRELEAKETMYRELQSSYNQTMVMSSEDLRRLKALKVTQEPTAPGGPVSPKRSLALLSGLLLGLLLGVFYAFVVEFLDLSVKTPDDIERKLGLRYIASLKKG